MKLNLVIRNGLASMLLLFSLILTKSAAFASVSAIMSVTNCSAGSNYIEFQVNITNTSTSGETLYINTPGAWKLGIDAGIFPVGPNNFTLTYVAGSADPLLFPIYAAQANAYELFIADSARKLNVIFSSAVLGPSTSSVNCPLYPGGTLNCGKFRFTITNAYFIAGKNVGLKWLTTSGTPGFAAYVNSSATTITLAGPNCTLMPPCGLTIPSCPFSASTSVSPVSCFGKNDGAASVSVTGTGPFTYRWSNGASGTSISGLVTGNYSVNVTGPDGCGATSPFFVPQPASLTATAIAGTVACQGDSTNIVVSASGGTSPYSGTGTFRVPAGDYSYTITDAKGCVATITKSVPGGTPKSTSVTTATACDSYLWSNNGLTYRQSGTYIGNVVNCVSNVLNLTVNSSGSMTAGTISGVSSVCTGNTVLFTSNGTAGGTWSSSNTAIASVNNVSTGADVKGVANGTATITYSVVNGCGNLLTANKNITVSNFSVSNTIAGPTNSCPYQGAANTLIAASNATYSITATSAASFNWTMPVGATLVSGQGTSSIQVHFASTYSSGNISVTVASNCGASPVTKSIFVSKGAINTVLAVSGPTSVCDYIGNGRLATYSVTPVAGAINYRWIMPQYSTIVSANADSSSVNVTFSSSFPSLSNSSKVISVKAVNGCGEGFSYNLSLTANIPGQALSILGPADVCQIKNGSFSTGKDTTYKIRRIPGAISYNWTVPSGMSIVSRPGFMGGVSSANDTLIVVRVTSFFSKGTISVTGSNGCGTGPAKTLAVTKSSSTCKVNYIPGINEDGLSEGASSGNQNLVFLSSYINRRSIKESLNKN